MVPAFACSLSAASVFKRRDLLLEIVLGYNPLRFRSQKETPIKARVAAFPIAGPG